MPIKIEWLPWDERQKAVVRRGPDNMSGRMLNWPYCTRCGLVALKNTVTRTALKKQCEWLDE